MGVNSNYKKAKTLYLETHVSVNNSYGKSESLFSNKKSANSNSPSTTLPQGQVNQQPNHQVVVEAETMSTKCITDNPL